MSFYNFPGFSQDTSFHPLFRLLDDFDTYSQGNTGRNSRSTMKSFSPKFDVKEVGATYELHGELPGIEQKDVEIEFTDDHTLIVKGRTERSYESGTPPATLIDSQTSKGAITEGENGHTKPQPAKVEDENENENENEKEAVATKEKETSTEVTKKDPETPKEPQSKYWVSERSVGQFSRTFSFPVRVDADAVKASMKNGILSIVVPKAQQKASRKITID